MRSNNIIVSMPVKELNAIIHLTGSKSESNRALILEAVSGGLVSVDNLSDAADTVTLGRIVRSDLPLPANHSPLTTLNIGPAGTAMRFLTAYAAVTGLHAIITGSERMKQRPIGILVDALRTLGANVSYVENDGFPPIQTQEGFKQKTAQVSIKGDVSSQYITAMLLIAPVLPLGLELQIEGELTSRPYIEMTLAMLQQAGIQHSWTANKICIPNQSFKPSTLTVEPDWSAASYWYSIAALSSQASLTLPYLKKYSLQGDSRITEIMANFGITSSFEPDGLKLMKEDKPFSKRNFDLKDCPDLAQTVIVCCAALGHEASFTGLETLKIKETDRIKALQNELAKMGVSLTEHQETYHLDCSKRFFPEKIFINTYDDHRMAMAFAPLAMVIKEVEIEDANVVEKSYPDFWKDLQIAGFKIVLSIE